MLRPSIIWCDSRAVPYGQKRLKRWAKNNACRTCWISGNFTASKLAWIKEHEPELYARIYKIMLPGDYIAMKLSGEICTTVSGLSKVCFGISNKLCGRLPDEILRIRCFADSRLKANLLWAGTCQCCCGKGIRIERRNTYYLSCRWSAQQCAFAERI